MPNLPSVTQILGDCFGRNPFWTDEGRYEGQLVHALLAADNRGVLDVDRLRERQPEYVGYIEGWRHVRATYGNIIAVEKEVRTNHYVGHLDVALRCDAAVVIVDFKCGNALPCHPLQTAAYAMAWNYAKFPTEPNIMLRACCYLDPDPVKCRLVPHTNRQDFDDWKIMLNYWYTMKRLVGWKQNEN